MKIISSFDFETKEAAVVIIKELVDLLGLKITGTTIKNDLLNHPDYPSLLSISDVLTGYGIENISLICTKDKIADMPMPFIALIKDENGRDTFTIVQSVTDKNIVFYPQKRHCLKILAREEFEKQWHSGIALMIDAEMASDEKNYAQKRREENRKSLATFLALLALPLIAITACLLTITGTGFNSFYPVLFTLFTIVGCIAGGLLLLHELDAHNPLLQQICTAGKRLNCSAILNSKASKIMGISWSTIGFTYFTGALLLILFTGITNLKTLFILSWLNACAAFYIFYSIYYQWRIAKQWCVLCLTVQALLALQCITAVVAAWHSSASWQSLLTISVIMPTVSAYALPFIIVTLLLPAYRSAKESKRYKTELQRLKNNMQIFEALLGRQKTVTESAVGLGITLGNPKATHKLIKVCNPYCAPCAQAHVTVNELLHNNPDLQIQIIFTATADENDRRAAPAKHLLAIAHQNNEVLTEKALNDWYTAKEKNYELFAAKYPMNGELKQQENELEAMHTWCSKTDIAFTPTFFVNGQQLPQMYTVSDLKYLLQTP